MIRPDEDSVSISSTESVDTTESQPFLNSSGKSNDQFIKSND